MEVILKGFSSSLHYLEGCTSVSLPSAMNSLQLLHCYLEQPIELSHHILTKLVELRICECNMSQPTLERMIKILETSQAKKLRTLDLQGNGLSDGPEECRVLASLFQNTSLAELSLEDNPIGNEGILAMFCSPSKQPSYARLDRLNLRSTHLAAKGIEAIAKSAVCSNLRALNISENRLDALAVETLADLTSLEDLEMESIIGGLDDRAFA